MNEHQKIALRLRARALGHVCLMRSSSNLAGDFPITIGIATIKIVTEEHVQALAYGDFTGEPEVITRIDPLGRDASDLEPFAIWLNEKVDHALAVRQPLRVWLPHRKALETLDILGHRYERSPSASAALRRAASILRVIAQEFQYSSQQVVAIARDLLTEHAVTGQMPVDDAHLGALLAWFHPVAGTPTVELARSRSVDPAAGILANYPGRRDDETVEVMRRRWKRSQGDARAVWEARIRSILHRAALDEWALLEEARTAFWELGLSSDGLDACLSDSRERLLWGFENGARTVKNALPRTRRMATLEHSRQQLDQAQLDRDGIVRTINRKKGRSVLGTVQTIDQPKPSQFPCRLVVLSTQRELRLRPDDKLSIPGTNVRGKVLSVQVNGLGAGSLIEIEVTNGVRSIRSALGRDLPVEWIPCDDFPLHQKLKPLNALTHVPWLLADGPSPFSNRHAPTGRDFLALAENHLGRRSR